MRSRLRAWLYATLWRSRMEQELDAELRLHVEAHAADLMRRGAPRCRRGRRVRIAASGCFGTVCALRRSPGFAAVGAFTLALGIGTATAVFSLVARDAG